MLFAIVEWLFLSWLTNIYNHNPERQLIIKKKTYQISKCMAPLYPLLKKTVELSCHWHSPWDYVLHFFTLHIRCFLNFVSEITYLKQISSKPLFLCISLTLSCGLIFSFPLVMFVSILKMNKQTKPVFQVAYFVLEPSGKLALQ